MLSKCCNCLFFFCVCLPCWIFGAEIAVVTMAIGKEYQKTVQKTIENKRAYCEKHQYDFVYGDMILDASRPIAWSKILLILEVMETSECEWIFWSDADSLIMNMDICLEDIIDENYNFILTRDLNALNTGQFLIRNCEWSRTFLQAVYNRTDCIHHPWWENQGVIKILEEYPEYLSLTKILPQRVMNSYAKEVIGNLEAHTFQSQDFIIHFAGVHWGARSCSLKSA